ncbi:hypothetical protein HYFRA_00000119 [Hymenoscyphus fraxineus]|uniref:Uncharacterized protein n=1 Tax=Hymenoscyphus fraxineus TaxID=746836 RepID=A0A9N9L389_9HELO|nr:hypothetical protein HYFRA_00000119 [Hymenoscyphus fraxineus]
MAHGHEGEAGSYPLKHVEALQIQPVQPAASPLRRRESAMKDSGSQFTTLDLQESNSSSPLVDKPNGHENHFRGPSRKNSLVSVETKYKPITYGFWGPRSPPSLSPDPNQTANTGGSFKNWWGWWHPMFLMYLFFVFGVVAAFGHHIFYASLHGTEAVDQFQKSRYGAALSFVAKASLMASVILAFRQQMWATFRRNSLSIDAIDSIFAVIEDLTVVRWESLKTAKVAMFLAFIVWVSPLTVILTPGTLTVVPSVVTNSTHCTNVRTLNFEPEATYDWRFPEEFGGLIERSLSLFNTTSFNDRDPNRFDYYTGAASPLSLAATLAAYTQSPIAKKDVAIDICGAGWNCSYEISFVGPGYKCLEYLGNGEDGYAPFSKKDIIPQGTFGYLANAGQGEYSPTQIDADIGGIPKSPPPWSPYLGAFRTEPIIWIGYATLKDQNSTFPHNSSDPRWATAFDTSMFSCTHHTTEYTVNFNYSSGLQKAKVTNRKFLAPIMNTTFLPNVDANDGTKDNVSAVPVEDYLFPQNTNKYRLTAAYHSLGLQLRNQLNGTVNFTESGIPISNTQAAETKLINPVGFLPIPNLMQGVQNLYEDIIISLLSNPQFLVVAWAANPNNRSGTFADGPSWPCQKSRNLNIFHYQVLDLWLVYGVFILLSITAIIFGLKAVQQNQGHFKKNRFSAIVAATRGPDLDSVDWTTDTHGRMAKGVGQTKLGYGIARQGVGERRGSYVGSGGDDGLGEMFYRCEVD